MEKDVILVFKSEQIVYSIKSKQNYQLKKKFYSAEKKLIFA